MTKLDFIEIFTAINLLNKVNKLPLEEVVKEWEVFTKKDYTSVPRISLFNDENDKSKLTNDTIIEEWTYTGLNNVEFLKIINESDKY